MIKPTPDNRLPCAFRLLQAILVLPLVLVLTLASDQATGCIMLDGTPSSSYEQLATNFQWNALWIKILKADTSNAYASAFRLNDHWAVTAAHVRYPEDGTTNILLQVGNSPNLYDATNMEVRSVAQFVIHPDFDSANPRMTPDLALIRFDSPLTAPTNFSLSSASFPRYERCTLVGWGRPGNPAVGYMEEDGKCRAFEASMGPVAGTSWTNFYSRIIFNPPFEDSTGRASPGDSGGGVVNQRGELGLIMTAASLGAGTGATYMLQLYPFKQWIIDNAFTPIGPYLSFIRTPAGCSVSWSSEAIGYTLQKSSEVASTNWSTVGAPITEPGQHPVTLTNSARSQEFFRLYKP